MIARRLEFIEVEGPMATLPLILPAYGHRSAQDIVSGRRHLHAQGGQCILSGPANAFNASRMSVAMTLTLLIAYPSEWHIKYG